MGLISSNFDVCVSIMIRDMCHAACDVRHATSETRKNGRTGEQKDGSTYARMKNRRMQIPMRTAAKIHRPYHDQLL